MVERKYKSRLTNTVLERYKDKLPPDKQKFVTVNNKEIYDGDIVKVQRCFTRPCVKNGQLEYNFTEGDEEVGQVMYLWNGSLAVSYEHIRSDDFDTDILHVKHRVEVIGNIHQNIELLKL